MKIGFSFSRCVRDIVDGTVDINDVLVIISRTDFDPRRDDHWKPIWSGYGGGDARGNPFNAPEWDGYGEEYESRFRDVAIELWESGKLHQPRQFGAYVKRSPFVWVETMLTDRDINQDPVLKDAWDKFQTVAGLTNLKIQRSKL